MRHKEIYCSYCQCTHPATKMFWYFRKSDGRPMLPCRIIRRRRSKVYSQQARDFIKGVFVKRQEPVVEIHDEAFKKNLDNRIILYGKQLLSEHEIHYQRRMTIAEQVNFDASPIAINHEVNFEV